jgi:endonuclease G
MISKRLMITNNHVLEDKEVAEKSQIEFNYQLDANGRQMETDIFGLRPDEFFFANQELDFTVVAVESKSTRGTDLAEFGYLPLLGQPGKVLEGEYVTCIEHPGGAYKDVALRENHLLEKQPNFLWYKTDTAPGSSGSPIFNDSWQVVALHHSGKPVEKDGQLQTIDGKNWTPDMPEDKIAWIANEGVRISSIVSALQQACGEQAIVRDALSVTASQLPEIHAASRTSPARDTHLQTVVAGGNGRSLAVRTPAEPAITPGVIDVSIPVNLRISLGEPNIPTTEVVGVERTAVYRKGYDENFLHTRLPLPVLNSTVRKDAVPFNNSPFIPYTHFTVCLSKSRQVGHFVAWNIDGEQLKAYGRKGFKFGYDSRISPDFQMGDEIYVDNKLDRGHLARRADVVWGTKAEATQANHDSFLFPNITPQHESFNQSEKHGLWGELENAIFAGRH